MRSPGSATGSPVESIDEARGRIHSRLRGSLPDGTVCLAGTHILATVDG